MPAFTLEMVFDHDMIVIGSGLGGPRNLYRAASRNEAVSYGLPQCAALAKTNKYQ